MRWFKKRKAIKEIIKQLKEEKEITRGITVVNLEEWGEK